MTKRALCFGVIIGVVVASAAHAADTTPQNEPLSWRSIIVRYDASGIDTNQRLKIGAPAVFAPYTTTDAITWAADLVIAPKRARDRQVMYAYDMSQLDPLEFKGLSEAARKDDLKVAVIAAQGPAVKVVGGTDGFYGTPVKWNSELFKVLAEKNGGKTSSVTTLLKDLR